MSKETFVRNHLAKVPGVIFEGEEAVLVCPFHQDTNPSLRVSLIRKVRPGGKGVAPGGFWCFACQTGGGWNKLAQKLSLPTWNVTEQQSNPEDPFWALGKDIEALQGLNQHEYRKPATDGVFGDSWRGLSNQFMLEYGAELLWDRKDEDYRIYLPVRDVSGNLVGHVGARPENSSISDKRKYINSYAFPAEKVWYCADREVGNKSVVVVEGPYDTLKFRSLGIPAIGAFGVSTLETSKLYQLIGAGIEKVILCLDGDRAGREATPIFAAKMEAVGLKVADLNLTEYAPEGAGKIDPGDAPPEVVADLKNFLQVF